MTKRKIRIGILGFGLIGQYIVRRLLDASHEQYIGSEAVLAFVWNRTRSKMEGESCVEAIGCSIPEDCILSNLDDMETLFPNVDVIVEVAHPDIYVTHGTRLLTHASVYVGSPTAFANADVLGRMREQSLRCHALYFPSGALWGAVDVLKMGTMRTLASVEITMRKPPHSFRLEEPLQTSLNEFISDLDAGSASSQSKVLYRGPVRGLCPLAPNNVNTMACLAIASGEDLGFDGCVGELIADNSISAHIIDITVRGKPITGRDEVFEVTTRRFNPCDPRQVTASATYPSFVASLKAIINKGSDFVAEERGIHFV